MPRYAGVSRGVFTQTKRWTANGAGLWRPIGPPNTNGVPIIIPGTPVNSTALVQAAMTTAHEDQPHGPASTLGGYSWYYGPDCENFLPPSNMGNGSPPTQCNFWHQCYYGSAGRGADTNTAVQIRMSELYYYSLTDSSWHNLQQSNRLSQYAYAFYCEDFVNNYNISANSYVTDQSANGGGIAVDMLPSTSTYTHGSITENFLFHSYSANRYNIPASGQGSVSDIGGMFSTCQARLVLINSGGTDDRNLANYVLNTGWDWWENSTGSNKGGANGQFKKLPTNGNWIACNAWSGPSGFNITTQGLPLPWNTNGGTNPFSTTSLTLANMASNGPPLNAMGP